MISRFLPATAITPAAVEALDVRPDSAEVDRVDLDAGHQLGLVDRLLDRLDRGLEIDDDTAADAARLGDAEADDVERRVVEQFADHGGDLRGADVQADRDIVLFGPLAFWLLPTGAGIPRAGGSAAA